MSFFKLPLVSKMSIKQRLILNNAVLMVAILFLAFFSAVKLTSLSHLLQDTTGKIVNITELNGIISRLEGMSSNIALKAMTGSDFSAEEFKIQVDTLFNKAINLTEKIEKIDTLKFNLEEYQNKYSNFVSMIIDANYLEAGEYVNNELAEAHSILMVRSDNQVNKSISDISKQNEMIRKNLSSSSYIVIITALIVIFVGLAISIFVVQSIISGLKNIINILKDIAQGEGNLTKRVVESDDELGEVAHWFNTFINKIQILIKQIADNSDTLTVSSIDLKNASSTLSSRAKDMSSRSNMVATTTEAAAGNVNNISSSAEVVSNSVSVFASSIEEMSATINEVAKNCQKEVQVALEANREVKVTQELMGKLGISAGEIGKVIETINDIADQTNLLALNATIEAASAGDSGKGFAVVASEVKELAKQTANATEEIRNQIEEMQKNTTDSVDAIEKIADIINDVNLISATISSAVEEQSSTINEVTVSMSDTNNSVSNVAHKVKETSEGLSDVASNITEVNNSANETYSGVEKIKKQSENLATISEDLENIVKQFKV